MIHGERKNGKAHGVVNTKKSVVRKMLDLANYIPERDLRTVKVLEPSAGEGAFTIEILKRLYKSACIHSFDFEKVLSNIYVCEIDKVIVDRLSQNIKNYLASVGSVSNAVHVFSADFLTVDFSENFDLVIGNPPYVRNENIPDDTKRKYQLAFPTFNHRSDLYIPFYEKGLKLLTQDGLLSYVCSNRWLKNQYGKRLRKLISSSFRLEFVIDLESAAIFDEEVLGYPAITNISRNDSVDNPPYFVVDNIDSFLAFDLTNKVKMPLNLKNLDWFAYSYSGAVYEKNLKKIEQQNYKIGIGVATGRDSIFIRNDLKESIESDLAIPILTSKDIKGDKIDWQGNYLLNPFDKDGNLINLDKYPEARCYLNEHKEELSKRHVAKKDAANWYKTIDKVDISLVKKPKVILPDISGNRFIHVDKGNYYPHHNLYYIIGGSYKQMCLMAAILMSDFVYNQLLVNGNKMNGGYPRWQSQNLRKLVIPLLTSIPEEIRIQLLDAYKKKNMNRINELITEDNIANFDRQEGQLALFEPELKYQTDAPSKVI